MTSEDTTARDKLMEAVAESWGPDTASEPRLWSEDTPSRGQCAVTALVVQDHLGGRLLRAINEDVSHYWNELPDGSELDLTRDQFETWAPVDREYRDSEYVLSFSSTAVRYRTLSQRVTLRLMDEAYWEGYEMSGREHE